MYKWKVCNHEMQRELHIHLKPITFSEIWNFLED